MLERLVNGEGVHGDLEALKALCGPMASASLCGLGQSAPTPVLDCLRHFREEFAGRVNQSVLLRSLKAIPASGRPASSNQGLGAEKV
jgi:hypothetical protein